MKNNGPIDDPTSPDVTSVDFITNSSSHHFLWNICFWNTSTIIFTLRLEWNKMEIKTFANQLLRFHGHFHLHVWGSEQHVLSSNLTSKRSKFRSENPNWCGELHKCWSLAEITSVNISASFIIIKLAFLPLCLIFWFMAKGNNTGGL